MTLHELDRQATERRNLRNLALTCLVIVTLALMATTGPADWFIG